MKLQRVRSRRLPKEYWKFQVVLPNDVVQKLGWHGNEELEVSAEEKARITIRQVSAPKGLGASAKPSYEECRNHVLEALQSSQNGLTWSEIRERHPILGKRPAAIWVSRLQKDIGLNRISDSNTGRVRWNLHQSNLQKGERKIDDANTTRRSCNGIEVLGTKLVKPSPMNNWGDFPDGSYRHVQKNASENGRVA